MRLAACLLVPLLCSAQTPPVIRSTTRLVQVNVIVRDKNGPVDGLKADDFVVLDKGKPQKIAMFSVDSSKNVLSASAPELPPNIFSNSITRRPNTPTSISIILLDGLNTPIQDSQYAQRQVRKFIAAMQPQDRIAIYTLGRTIRVLHDFTSDKEQLGRVIGRFRGATDMAASELRPEVIPGLDAAADAAIEDFISSAMQNERQSIILETLRSMDAIAKHVAPLPGRKNLIWVSASFPVDLTTDSITVRFGKQIRRTAATLQDANIAVYPVDARGLLTAGVVQAGAALRGSVTQDGPRGRVLSAPMAALPPDLNLDSMKSIAMQTGGKAFYNTNDLAGAIRQAIDDTELTYTLGYYPSDATPDGSYHEIKVQVPDRKGLEVRSRKGYYAREAPDSPATQVKSEVDNALWSPLETHAVPLAARVDRRGDLLGITAIVTPSDLALAQQDGRYTGTIEFVVAQVDTAGTILKASEETLSINLKKESYQEALKNGFHLRKSMQLEPSASNLRIVIVDRTSFASGSLIVPVSRILATN